MSWTEDYNERTGKQQKWVIELEALAKHLRAEDRKNGWHVRYGYFDPVPDPELTILVTIEGSEFARFKRHEAVIIGVFEEGKPLRFSNRFDAFDAAVKRRVLRQKLRGAP
jgi:hypothetical protein